jgi:hypothetical protein
MTKALFDMLAMAYDIQCRKVVDLELELDKFCTSFNEATLHLNILQAKSIKTKQDEDELAKIDQELQFYDNLEYDFALKHKGAYTHDKETSSCGG